MHCPWVTPELLLELAGPRSGLQNGLSKVLKLSLKAARSGRAVEHSYMCAASCICCVLATCRELEEVSTEYRMELLSLDCIPNAGLQARAHQSLEEVRGSPLRELHEAVAAADSRRTAPSGSTTAQPSVGFGLFQLGFILGEQTEQQMDESLWGEAQAFDARTEADREADRRLQEQATDARTERLFHQVSGRRCCNRGGGSFRPSMRNPAREPSEALGTNARRELLGIPV